MTLHPPGGFPSLSLLLVVALSARSAAGVDPQAVATAATEPSVTAPAYQRRGDGVQAKYEDFRRDLDCLYERLFGAVAESPELARKLAASTPPALDYGYQVLPKVVADLPPLAKPPRVISSSFSWPITEGRLALARTRLANLKAALDEHSSELGAAVDRASLETLVIDYLAIHRDTKLVESNVQYNRLWQKEIDQRRADYDGNTILHDAVLERERILERLRELGASAESPIPGGSRSEKVAPASAVEAAGLLEREQVLGRQIRAAVSRAAVPEFVRVERAENGPWLIRVPLYTDIEDESFLEQFRSAVENAWRVTDDQGSFRVALDLRRIAPRSLYGSDAECDVSERCRVPAFAERIDLTQHVARFPSDGAVLTTGANLTHVNGRSIRLGPQDIAPNVLAHEFGHLLGFVDGYFRGYRDLGEDGYEVLEVVIDPADIMSAPGYGRAQRAHFERLVSR